MGKINVLDELTANQIAAGEVVERPASVVKELVENAIDAGGTTIEVEIEDGGIKSIGITDNGSGLEKEDVALAFQRHATSKIRVAEDLDMINTLGFRGEALPSIAAVAEVEMNTRPARDTAGSRIVVRGSEVLQHRETGCPAGTTVRITDLFYNTPARLKHMKSATVEGGHCGDVVTRLALAHPEISFRFRHNDREVFQTTGSGDLRDTIASLFGVRFTRDMLSVTAGEGAFNFRGYLGKPAVSRASRHHQYIFVNGRYIRSRLISEAVEKGYHTMLMTGRRPVFVLAFEVDPRMVDVNIHPTKLEVRFQQEKELAAMVTDAVRAALLENPLIPQAIDKADEQAVEVTDSKAGETAIGEAYVQDRLDFKGRRGREEEPAGGGAVREIAAGYQQVSVPVPAPLRVPVHAPDTDINMRDHDIPRGVEIFPDLRPLGQIDNTYIVAGGDDGLYLVDQHAAHERILYEKFFSRCGQKDFTQELLLPVTMELGYQDAQVLLNNIVVFTELGFIIEHFGGDTFLLRGAPLAVKKGEEKKIFLDLLDYFSLNQHKITGKELREHLIIGMACKAAIKANQRLSPEEITSLLADLAGTAAPFTCPHGRPTVIHMTNYELQKKFKRVL
ncbi:MAG: DNA mismatch repair endonuclease MutL [Bacillota bacterium]